MSAVAVLDVGKTNVKLTAASREGELLETVSLANAPGRRPALPPHRRASASRRGSSPSCRPSPAGTGSARSSPPATARPRRWSMTQGW